MGFHIVRGQGCSEKRVHIVTDLYIPKEVDKMKRYPHYPVCLIALIFILLLASCKKDPVPVAIGTLDAPQRYQLYSAQSDGSVSLKWGYFQICQLWPCPSVLTPVKYQVFISEGGPEDFRFYTELPSSKTELTIGGLKNDKPYLFQVVVIGKRDSVVTTNRVMAAPISRGISDAMRFPQPTDVSRSYDGRFDALTTYRASSGSTLILQEGQSPEVVVRGNAQAPAWAPADYRLAYQTSDGLAGPTYPAHIYVYDVEQGTHRQIVGGQRRNVEPAWSPDGRSLLFLSDRGGESANFDLWSVDVADTTKVQRLTTMSATNEAMSGLAPTWSPDGSKVAFTAAPSADGNIRPYTLRIVEMDADGTNRRVLVESEWNDYNPVYSPLGDRIAFFSDRSGGREIWTMIRATGALRQLTYTDDLEHPSYYVQGGLQWSPDGSGLYFTGVKSGAEYGYFFVDSFPLAH